MKLSLEFVSDLFEDEPNKLVAYGDKSALVGLLKAIQKDGVYCTNVFMTEDVKKEEK